VSYYNFTIDDMLGGPGEYSGI